MKKIVQCILVCQLSLLFILFIWNPTTARGEINRSKVVDRYHEMVRETEVGYKAKEHGSKFVLTLPIKVH